MGRIKLDGVTKHFDGGDVVAVDDVSLDVADGEFLVLLGPSGCGKSTTLRMIAGLETPTEGDVSIGDRVVNGLQPRDRDVAMVFQNYALYPHMTVRENMSFGLELSTELTDDEIETRVRDTAEMMDIGDLLDQKPKELSGGQQQRAALGRAIVRDPEAFLFDEPLSNLDAKLRAHMRTEIARLQQDLGVTSVYVTHDQAEAMTMGDRIAVMNDGVLQQTGTPNEVYDHPTNQFVADFIGEPSMNFLAVKLRSDGDYALVGREESGFTYPLSADLVDRLDVSAGDRLTLGVRPEDADVVDGGGDRAQTAEVAVVEEMGSDDFVYLDVGPDTWTVRSEDRVGLEPGQSVEYAFDPANVYLFDAGGRTVKSRGLDEKAVTSGTERPTRPIS